MLKTTLPILAALLMVVAGCVTSGNPVEGPRTVASAAGAEEADPGQAAVDPTDRAVIATAETEFIVAAERFEKTGQHAMLSVMNLAIHGGVDAQKVGRPIGRWHEALGQFHIALERYKGSRSAADATEVLRLIGVQRAVMEEIKDAMPGAKELAG